MSKRIDEKQVREVAMLGRLELSDGEVSMFSDQLSEILNYVEKLGELDTENVEPLAHSLPVQNVFREDQPHQSLSRDRALSNAPHCDDEFFLVPRILDENGGA
jgi:aspartyl-tRNA(Asn)/glutamyl-tRNA(Gln) amidotransferase subunit C